MLEEKKTRSQSDSADWHEARRLRITGSKCGHVLMQKKKTEALLRYCIYPKPKIHLPKAILWGRTNEDTARLQYVKYMQTHGHPNLEAKPAGFVVHPIKGWQGASPDAWVTDPTCT